MVNKSSLAFRIVLAEFTCNKGFSGSSRMDDGRFSDAAQHLKGRRIGILLVLKSSIAIDPPPKRCWVIHYSHYNGKASAK